MSSPSSVLTLGLGSWGSVSDMITLGYGSGAAPAVSGPPDLASLFGRDFVSALERRRTMGALEERGYFSAIEER